jgi:site-specific DNA recombinase
MDAKLIAIYARVSTARQEEERTVENQLSALREYARTHGHTIAREYIDDGWSGDVLARPALDDLRQDAKRKIWDAVLIYDPDRLARRYSYQELVTDELREANIDVIFTTVATPKNPEDKILHGVRGLFAEYERAKISERFRLGKIRKLREGHILTTDPLYGYRYIPKREGRHGYYEINEEEAKVVRMIFTWVADHSYTLRKVVRGLQELNIKPRKSRRGVWNTSTLCTLLRHKGYVGEAHWGKTYAVIPVNPLSTDKYRKKMKSSRKIRPESEWMKVPIPALIDRDLFNRAQDRLDSNLALCQRNKKNEYLLAGKIRCVCGRTRSGEGPLRGKHLYYRCSDRAVSFPLPPKCSERSINARIADQLVWEKISSMMSSPQLLEDQLARWLDGKNQPAPDQEGKEVLRDEISKLRKQEDRYNSAYGAGLFTLEQLRDYVTPIRDKIAAAEAQIRELDGKEREPELGCIPNEGELKEFALRCKEKLANLNFADKRGIVLKTVDKVVGDQQQLQIYGHIPVTDYVNVFTNDRHGQDKPRLMKSLEVPFEFSIELPPPLRRGVGYGFLPGGSS